MERPDNPPPYPGFQAPSAPSIYPYNQMPQPSAPMITPSASSMTHYPTQQVSVITAQPVHSSPTVIVQSVNAFSSHPHAATCLHCHRNITTTVRYESSCKTHFFAVCLFVFGCSCGCCLIPYCIDGCKGVIHSCELNWKKRSSRFSNEWLIAFQALIVEKLSELLASNLEWARIIRSVNFPEIYCFENSI